MMPAPPELCWWTGWGVQPPGVLRRCSHCKRNSETRESKNAPKTQSRCTILRHIPHCKRNNETRDSKRSEVSKQFTARFCYEQRQYEGNLIVRACVISSEGTRPKIFYRRTISEKNFSVEIPGQPPKDSGLSKHPLEQVMAYLFLYIACQTFIRTRKVMCFEAQNSIDTTLESLRASTPKMQMKTDGGFMKERSQGRHNLFMFFT